MTEPRFLTAGDSALTVEFGSGIAEAVNERVCALDAALQRSPIAGVCETVPTFRSLLICYDPVVLTEAALKEALRERLRQMHTEEIHVRRVIELPVCYGGAFGPDLPDVAAHAGMSEEEVIALHAGRDYLIYMLGFLPGFPYLGGLDARLHTPRLSQPRTRIPAGAVGIGGSQTGVYPLASPGGWRLIGRTPIRPYDPLRNPPILYEAGDCIRFRPIDEGEFVRIERAVEDGSWQPVTAEGGRI